MIEQTRVFVVDDDALVRRAVSRLLKSDGYSVEAFESPQAILDAGTADQAACLVLDLRMPGLNGLELVEELRRLRVATPVVFITGHADVPTSVQAMKAGAIEFLEKPFDDERLLEAVREAAERDRSNRRDREDLAALEALAETLTTREREVMGLVVQGLLNKQIAGRLGIAEKTVKVHRGRVMEKMEAGSLAELVRLAGRLGIP